ncbi:hypothetical protein JXA80_06865, partial [bacterium]|nr:hypothetical protein [candidate division CSSED10-310 bacterium]
MKQIFWISLAGLLVWVASAQGSFIPFSGAATVDDVTAWKLTENRSSVSIALDFPGLSVEDVELDNTVYQQVDIQGCGLKGADGFPMLPFKGLFIEVPHGVTIQVAETACREISVDGEFMIYPKQPDPLDCGDDTQPVPVINQKAYLSDRLFPEQRVEMT